MSALPDLFCWCHTIFTVIAAPSQQRPRASRVPITSAQRHSNIITPDLRFACTAWANRLYGTRGVSYSRRTARRVQNFDWWERIALVQTLNQQITLPPPLMRGDFGVLAERGRRMLHAHIARDVDTGIAVIDETARRTLA